MDVAQAIGAFAQAGHVLPREAMRWALDHWDEAAPELLGMLERFVTGADRSEDAANALFFVLHLAGEKRETRVFGPLCRLARDAEALDQVLGEGTTTTFNGILIGTYDGDLDTLEGLIEAEEADEFVRSAALEALAYLAATGRIEREEAKAYLLRLYDTLQPQEASWVWSGWAMAVAHLGFEALAGTVRKAFRRGLIDPMDMGYDHFQRELGRTLADPERMAGFKHERIRPLDDAIGELAGWYGFSEEARRAAEQPPPPPPDPALLPPLDPTLLWPPPPVVNPFKGVGRNDPCPCGSGKKFKKCCLK
jgi:hypothetical protein